MNWWALGVLVALVPAWWWFQKQWTKQVRESERLRCQTELIDAGLRHLIPPADAIAAVEILEGKRPHRLPQLHVVDLKWQ